MIAFCLMLFTGEDSKRMALLRLAEFRYIDSSLKVINDSISSSGFYASYVSTSIHLYKSAKIADSTSPENFTQLAQGNFKKAFSDSLARRVIELTSPCGCNMPVNALKSECGYYKVSPAEILSSTCYYYSHADFYRWATVDKHKLSEKAIVLTKTSK